MTKALRRQKHATIMKHPSKAPSAVAAGDPAA
jgi:hypothetical protein